MAQGDDVELSLAVPSCCSRRHSSRLCIMNSRRFRLLPGLGSGAASAFLAPVAAHLHSAHCIIIGRHATAPSRIFRARLSGGGHTGRGRVAGPITAHLTFHSMRGALGAGLPAPTHPGPAATSKGPGPRSSRPRGAAKGQQLQGGRPPTGLRWPRQVGAAFRAHAPGPPLPWGRGGPA